MHGKNKRLLIAVCTVQRKQHAFFPNRLSWLVLPRDKKLSVEERQELDVLRSADVEVAQAVILVQTFVQMVRGRVPTALDPWL